MKYWQCVCSGCRGGRVFVMRSAERLLLQCEECKVTWAKPDDTPDPARAIPNQPPLTLFAGTLDLENAHWSPSAFHKITDNRTIC